MNADYIRIAHRRAVWAQLQRILLDRFIATDSPAQETIICEEVPYAHKDVSNEALLEVLEMIQQHEVDEQLDMRDFEFKRRAPRERRQQSEQPAADGQQASAPSGSEAKQPTAESGSAPAAPAGEQRRG